MTPVGVFFIGNAERRETLSTAPYWPEVVKKEQGSKPRNGSLPPSSYFATSSESSRSTFDTSPHSFS